MSGEKAVFLVEGGGPFAVEDGELAGSRECVACVCATLQCCAYQLCATLQYPANQLDPPAITHRYRGPPSF